jgi:predicted porin
MKKSLIVLAALAALDGAALAQSSVTIYGKIDLSGVLDSGGKAGKSVRISSGASGASRLGFKGVEDLGNGLKAGFTLETGFCADSAAGDKFAATSNVTGKPVTDTAANFCSANNAFMGRQAHGDLTGSFGAISAGRQFVLNYTNLQVLDPFGIGYAGQIGNIVDLSGTRLNNSVRYTTPVFSGFTLSGETALGEVQGNWKGNRELGGAAIYASGPVYATVSVSDYDNANGDGTSRRNILFGGTYDFGILKLHALGQKATGNPTGAAKVDVLDLLGGATVPLAGGSLLASYVHHDDRGVADKDAAQWGVGYNYPLSKRTAVYTAFARIVNHHGATFTVGNNSEVGTGDKAFNLGVVHNF